MANTNNYITLCLIIFFPDSIENISNDNGWDKWSMIQSSSFSSILRARNRSLEIITDKGMLSLAIVLCNAQSAL